MQRIRWKLAILRLLLIWPLATGHWPLWAQGTVSATVSQLGQTSVWVIQFNWTGDSGGNVPVTAAGNLPAVQGYEITQIECAPGTPPPSTTYSVAVLDSSGNDVLAGAGNNVSGGQAQTFNAASSTPPLQGTLRLQITNNTAAGGKGVVYVFLQKPGTLSAKKIRGMGGAGGNVIADWLTLANSPFADARRYNFPPQTPGGTLTAGSNTITLQPVPLGVNGSDYGHQLYVSGGAGTAEPCTITGGSAVAGSATGTLTLNCANAHAGAWTVRSASNGIAEAVQVLVTAGHGGIVSIPPGVYTQCGTVKFPGDGIQLIGSGSSGNGPIRTGGSGAAGTIIQPCTTGQIMFYVDNGHAYWGSAGVSTVARLSMRDIGFTNNGLAGIDAVYVLRDTNGTFDNLSFYGTAAQMWGLYLDRCSGTRVRGITATGTVNAMFGSATDNDELGGSSYSQELQVNNYWYLGAGGGQAAVMFQRCIQCILTNSNFNDQLASGAGIAIEAANDTQGLTISSVSAQGYQIAILLQPSTVGGTYSAPSWTSITDAQLDCASPASSNPANGCGYTGGNGFTAIHVGAGTYFTSITNPTLTGSVSPAGLISIEGNALSFPNVKVNGGLIDISSGNGIIITTTGGNPITAVSIQNATFYAPGSGFSPLTINGGAVNGLVFNGNTIMGPPSGPISLTNGGTIASGYVGGNWCNIDPGGYCGSNPSLNGSALLPANVTTNVTLGAGANENILIGTSVTMKVSGPSGAFSLGGFNGGFQGRHLTVLNYTGQQMTINYNDTGSAAANRIVTMTGGNVALRAGNSVASFVYDGANWILTSTN